MVRAKGSCKRYVFDTISGERHTRVVHSMRSYSGEMLSAIAFFESMFGPSNGPQLDARPKNVLKSSSGMILLCVGDIGVGCSLLFTKKLYKLNFNII